MTDRFMDARLQMIHALMQMVQVGAWMKAHEDKIDNRTALILGTAMMIVCQYASITVKILNDPNVELPQRKCIFW